MTRNIRKTGFALMSLLVSTSCFASDPFDFNENSFKGHVTQTTSQAPASDVSQADSLEAPKVFHFIWVGGNLPEKYLNNIYTCAARGGRDGYKVKVWVNKPSQFYQTVCKSDRLIYKNISVHTIDTLIPFMKEEFSETNQKLAFDDQVFANKSKLSAATEMIAYIEQEMVGKYNYSAVADWLRKVILLKEGGIYSDTDHKFQKEKDLDICGLGFSKIDLPHGVKFINPHNNFSEIQGKKIDIQPSMDTHLVMAQPGNALIRKILLKFVDNYKDCDFIDRYMYPYAVQRNLTRLPKDGLWKIVRAKEATFSVYDPREDFYEYISDQEFVSAEKGTYLICTPTKTRFSALDIKRAHGDLDGSERRHWCSETHSVSGLRRLFSKEYPTAVLEDLFFTSSQLGKMTLQCDGSWHAKPSKLRYSFVDGAADIARTFR